MKDATLEELEDMGIIKSRVRKEKKIKIFKPIPEESIDDVCTKTYKDIFKRCHSDLKQMCLRRNGSFFKSLPKLVNLIGEVLSLKQQYQLSA